jgi:hypothetical protein
MAAGFRSPLPILGLAAGTVAPAGAAVRSMLAPWMGGASVGMAPTTPAAGPRSMLAFWMGGAGLRYLESGAEAIASHITGGAGGFGGGRVSMFYPDDGTPSVRPFDIEADDIEIIELAFSFLRALHP